MTSLRVRKLGFLGLTLLTTLINFLKPKEKINPKEFFALPNLISVFRILAAVIIFIAAVTYQLGLWVAVLYLAAVLSDKIDGTIARFLERETRLGRILEPIADATLAYATVTYLFLNLFLPRFIFYLAAFLLVLGLVLNFALYFIRRVWFIPKIPSSRLALVVLHLCGIFYFFDLPYKNILIYLLFAFGLFAYFDYLLRLILAKNKEDTT